MERQKANTEEDIQVRGVFIDDQPPGLSQERQREGAGRDEGYQRPRNKEEIMSQLNQTSSEKESGQRLQGRGQDGGRAQEDHQTPEG